MFPFLSKNYLLFEIIYSLQGVQQNCSHLVICSFVGFYSCKMQKLGHFWKNQEICYMIGTRILKIDLEIAEIIEVKVGNHHLEIDILLLHRGRNIISMLRWQFWRQISWIFQKCQLQFAWVEADKRANNQVGTVLLDTLYNIVWHDVSR